MSVRNTQLPLKSLDNKQNNTLAGVIKASAILHYLSNIYYFSLPLYCLRKSVLMLSLNKDSMFPILKNTKQVDKCYNTVSQPKLQAPYLSTNSLLNGRKVGKNTLSQAERKF